MIRRPGGITPGFPSPMTASDPATASSFPPLVETLAGSAAGVPDVAQATAAVPLVELRDVTVGYAGKPVLEHIDIVIPRGSVVAMMGTSGGGKTTILRLIGGQL